MRRRRNTNSPIAAAVTIIVGVLAFLIGDLPGLAWYVLGFFVGGAGVAVNFVRWLRARGGAFDA